MTSTLVDALPLADRLSKHGEQWNSSMGQPRRPSVVAQINKDR